MDHRRVHDRVREPAAHRRAASATSSGARALSSSASSSSGSVRSAAGLVDSPQALILTRGVQGLGAAFIMPTTLSILTNVFPDDQERARGDRDLGRRVGAGRRDRTARRRLAARALLVGIDLPRQPADRDRGDPRGDRASSRLGGERAADRHPRDGAVDHGLTALLYGVIEGPNNGWTDPTWSSRSRSRRC